MTSGKCTAVPSSGAAARTPSSPPASAVPTSDIQARAIRILLVDDEPETARSLQRELQEYQFQVDVTESAPEALSALPHGQYDVVLSDISMPDMDGFDLLQAIQDFDAHLPVILLTGFPQVSTAARALELGAFRYVTKPIQIEKLGQTIERAAGVHRSFLLREQAERNSEPYLPPSEALLSLSRHFDRCLEKLYLAFQPIVDLKQKSVFGYESLMRSSEDTLPHPGAVLDAAEKLGRLHELGRTIRQLAAQAIQRNQTPALFFVNLHVRDLLDPHLSSAHSLLAHFTSQVVLEITERSSLAEIPDILQNIARLREMGFRIAIDDLGAGYAGLTSFALLEPDFVKLDMSLIRDIQKSPIKQKVVRSMINLAQDMGILVVGEGVELEEESQVLHELGCDYQQGYYFARPAPLFPEVRFDTLSA